MRTSFREGTNLAFNQSLSSPPTRDLERFTMSPMSLLTLSPDDLQAAHNRDEDGRPSPSGERMERNHAAYLGLVMLFVPFAVMLMLAH